MIYVLFIAFIIMSASVDVEHFKQYQYIDDHTSRVILRSIVAIGFMNGFLDLIIFFLLWMGLFDVFINWIWNKKISYIGGRATIDLFWRKHPKIYLPVKAICLIMATALIIFT